MTTARDLITDAASACGGLGQGETLSADDAAHCLRRFQRLVDSLSNDTLTVYVTTEQTVSLVGGTTSYLTSSFSPATRPVTIQNVFLRQGTIDYPLTEMSQEEYDRVPSKSDQGLPGWYFYKPGMPAGTFYLYPTPDQTYTMYVNGRYPLASSMTLDTTI